jgi:hypothetical protein
MITEALIGVVRFKPLKKNNWFIATPNTAQSASRGKSERAIFSFDIN